MSRSRLNASAVIDVAVKLADDVGFDGVSLSAVARQLGVQAPSLYAHVRDLSALRDGIAERALHDLSRRTSAAIAGRSGIAALRGLADAYRSFARESPGGWQSLQRRVGGAAVASDAARDVVDLTAAVLRGYPLPEGEYVHAVRLIGSTINGFINLEAIGSFDHSDPAPDLSWDKTVSALDVVLRAWPTEAGIDSRDER